jgi:NADH-quinone oxidoreductase subunit C
LKTAPVVEKLAKKHPHLQVSVDGAGHMVVAEPESLLALAKDIKKMGYTYFSFVTAVDYGEEFELVYRFRSIKKCESLTLKVRVPRDKPEVESVSSIWSGADWHEREVYDLFGIVFKGHPDLRRILLPEDWEGYPLRKDYQDKWIVKRPNFY